ncbi:MAG TPA: CU044_5270 family protein [Pseudonocardiaceae bacterium]|nr:CU044_5270 family protein [Pseudonocardiaceae bacterium]
MADQVHPIWTEDELDTALAGLHNDRGPANLASARTALYAALGAPEPIIPKSRRRWPHWAAAAAVVALLVSGALVIRSGPTSTTQQASAAVLTLRKAATAAIGERDPVVKPGQYLYIRQNAWWENTIVGTKTFDYLADSVTETWVPADRTGTWMQRRSIIGQRKWVIGTETEAAAGGIPPDDHTPSELTAPCGDFYPATGHTASCADVQGNWQNPTPAWLATLPTDPHAMLDRLKKDSPAFKPGNGLGDAELFVYVADALRGGLVPAKVRAVFYQTLALLPELKVTEQVANLDGRTGVAMGVDSPESPVRQEIIIDPVTGQFIGERTVVLKPIPGFAAGAMTGSSSVTTSVVNSIGSTR